MKKSKTSKSNKRTSSSSYRSYGMIKSPRGKTYEVDNISAFARKHKLDRSAVSRVLNGIRLSHKNWQLA